MNPHSANLAATLDMHHRFGFPGVERIEGMALESLVGRGARAFPRIRIFERRPAGVHVTLIFSEAAQNRLGFRRVDSCKVFTGQRSRKSRDYDDRYCQAKFFHNWFPLRVKIASRPCYAKA